MRPVRDTGRFAFAAAVAIGLLSATTTIAGPSPASAASAPAAESEWLATVNRYRAVAGVGPVVESADASAGAALHAQYLLRNRVTVHTEDPGRPGYSAAGLRAAMTGHVASGAGALPTQRSLIEDWMAAPFHGLEMIRPDATAFGFALTGTAKAWAGSLPVAWDEYAPPGRDAASVTASLDAAAARVVARYPELANKGWSVEGFANLAQVTIAGRRFEVRSGAVTELGPKGAADAARTVVWPGDGTSVPLFRFSGNEFPDPLTSCPGFTAPVGLPVYLRRGVPTEVSRASMVDSTGVAQSLCILTAATYVNAPDASAQALVRSLLEREGAVILVPKAPLTPGRSYAMDVTPTDGQPVRWTFSVSTDGSVSPRR